MRLDPCWELIKSKGSVLRKTSTTTHHRFLPRTDNMSTYTCSTRHNQIQEMVSGARNPHTSRMVPRLCLTKWGELVRRENWSFCKSTRLYQERRLWLQEEQHNAPSLFFKNRIPCPLIKPVPAPRRGVWRLVRRARNPHACFKNGAPSMCWLRLCVRLERVIMRRRPFFTKFHQERRTKLSRKTIRLIFAFFFTIRRSVHSRIQRSSLTKPQDWYEGHENLTLQE